MAFTTPCHLFAGHQMLHLNEGVNLLAYKMLPQALFVIVETHGKEKAILS